MTQQTETLFDAPARNRPVVTGEMLAKVAEDARKWNSHVCAIAFDRETGEMYDAPFNWETARTMAGEYSVVAIDDDRHYMPKAQIQALCDYEIDIYDDCFGRPSSYVYN